MLIANPRYDVVFKYLFADDKVARQVLWRLLRAGAEKNILDGMDVEDDIVNEFKFRGRKPDRSPSTEPRYGSPPRPSSSG